MLQVSTEDVCFLFRLNYVGMHPAIIRFLTDKKVPKIGLSWHDDLNQLHKRADFEPGNFIEIQDMAKDLGLIDMSLQKIYANLFHQKISKAQRLSNWEVTELKDSQKYMLLLMLGRVFNSIRSSTNSTRLMIMC